MNSNKDYVEPSPIQIRVFENKLEIINGGVLLEGWTVETLLSSHRSIPYNLDIANTFFRAGEIEAWGRGIERIITACKNDGFLKGHPVATRKEISESLSNITEDGVNTTSRLQELGLLKRVGGRKQGYWQIIE